jgi:hypothetical protein
MFLLAVLKMTLMMSIKRSESVERPWELILYNLRIEKSDLDEVD